MREQLPYCEGIETMPQSLIQKAGDDKPLYTECAYCGEIVKLMPSGSRIGYHRARPTKHE